MEPMTFCPKWIKDVGSTVRDTPDWLVRGLLPKRVLALLAAYPKVGKSTLAAQLSVAVAQGKDFLGQPSEQGSVLYVVAEEHLDDVIRRFRRVGLKENEGPICFWSDVVSNTQTNREAMKKFIQEKQILLVVIDTLATYLMLDDETDNSKVTRHLKPYLDIAYDSGTTILFVHHERKSRDEGDDDSRAIRGAGAILGVAGLAFQLQKEPGGGTRRLLKMTGRYQEIPRALKLDYQNDKYLCLGTPEEHARAVQRENVLGILPTTGTGLTVEEAMSKTGLGEKATRQALECARTFELATRTGDGFKGDPYRYKRVDVGSPPPATDVQRAPVHIVAEKRSSERSEGCGELETRSESSSEVVANA